MPWIPRAVPGASVLLTLAWLAGLAGAPAAAVAGESATDSGLVVDPTCRTWLVGEAIPAPAELEAQGARVRRILVRAKNIFDPEVPGESFWAFRLANQLHLTTRERVILHRLVFAPGEPYRERRLAESERLLRRDRFLYDAVVRPVAYCDGDVDIEVITRDVWSLKPGASFNRKGGENAWKLELQDSNFLGLGTDLTLSRDENVDRTTTLARYRDDDFLGRRLRFELWYSDNSDGELMRLAFERPFRSLDSRSAAGLRAFRDQRIDSIYRLGEIDDRFAVDQEYAEVSFGRSRGAVAGRTARLRFGATWDRRRYSVPPGELRHRPLPPDRRFAYPWVAGEWIEDGYIEAQNLDRIDRTEDLNLGRRGNAWLGLVSRALGSDRNAALFGASLADGFAPRRGQLLLAAASLGGRVEGNRGQGIGGLRDGQVALSLRYYWRDLGRHLFFASLTFDAAYRLDPERQLLLGGDNGLRGYPLRYQEGNRRILLTLEQRFYHPAELFHLVRIGGAVFADVGRAWSAGEPGPPSLGVLRDVGLGLRIGSSRSANASMIHLDVAFPLDARRGERQVQWLVTTSDTF